MADPKNFAQEAINVLQSRFSVSPKYLVEPPPTKQDYLEATKAALCAPDHRHLHPCRIVQIASAQRAKLAELFEQAAIEAGADNVAIQKAKSKALKGPALVAIITKIDHNNSKVPVFEQWFTVGAYVMNFMNVMLMKGFAGKIVSGTSTHQPLVQKALCRENEEVAAWLILGTPGAEAERASPRPMPEEFFNTWN